MLNMLEDATVIYRVSRAAERRIFNVEVGQLPKQKAEQYVQDMMTKQKNRLVYDAKTGEIRDDRKFQTMYEDFWFPKRGNQGTTIETLPAGQNLGELSDVNYFKGKLYESLNIPGSRLNDSSTPFNVGRGSEITRDELDFQKFIDRIRVRFCGLFVDILGTQLILKGVLTKEDWENDYKDKIWFEFVRDNYYAEFKNSELWAERAELLTQLDSYEGKYFSKVWLQENVLKMNKEEISRMMAEIKAEKELSDENPTYQDFDTGETPDPTDLNNPEVPPDQQELPDKIVPPEYSK
jgi:hypothetical protein